MNRKLSLIFTILIAGQWAFAEATMTISSIAQANLSRQNDGQTSSVYSSGVTKKAAVSQAIQRIKSKNNKDGNTVDNSWASFYQKPESKEGNLEGSQYIEGKTIAQQETGYQGGSGMREPASNE